MFQDTTSSCPVLPSLRAGCLFLTDLKKCACLFPELRVRLMSFVNAGSRLSKAKSKKLQRYLSADAMASIMESPSAAPSSLKPRQLGRFPSADAVNRRVGFDNVVVASSRPMASSNLLPEQADSGNTTHMQAHY